VVKVYNYQQHSKIQQHHMDSLDLPLEDIGLLAVVVVDHNHYFPAAFLVVVLVVLMQVLVMVKDQTPLLVELLL